jgi:MFS family permease
MTSVTAPRPRSRVPAGPGFWVVGVVFATAMAFSTVPAPLYSFYRERDGFSTFWITVVFAAYAVGVVGALFLGGHVSDWLGRRRLLVAALVAESVAAVSFLVWSSLTGLIVARIVTGIGVGLITATATAHMGELHAVARPDAGRTRAERASVAANMGGLALGPLIAGALAQWVDHPLTVPYLLFLVLLLASVLAVAAVPETVDLTRDRPRYRPQRVIIPPQGRSLYFTVAAAAFAGFSVLGLFTSVAPGFIASLGHRSPALSGTIVFLVFAAGAGAQILTSGLPAARQVRIGLALMAGGVLVMALAVHLAVLVLFTAGGVVAGAGVGAMFKGALATVGGLAPAHARGEALAGLFLTAYVGLVIPVVAVGVATVWVPLADAMLGLAAGVLLVTAAVTGLLRRVPADG